MNTPDHRTDYYKALEREIKANPRFCVDGGDIRMREARDLLRKLDIKPTDKNEAK